MLLGGSACDRVIGQLAGSSFLSSSVLVSSAGASGFGAGPAGLGLAGCGLAGCGVRSDNLATTIVIAAASTARPASWPPIRRGSSGSAEDVCWTLIALRWSFLFCPAWGEAVGVTVGKRPPRLGGVM